MLVRQSADYATASLGAHDKGLLTGNPRALELKVVLVVREDKRSHRAILT
jgi:hypothetical protein